MKIMATYKAKIFDQSIDLNYKKEDKSKLLRLIDSLNSHWNKFDHLKGRVSDNKILILISLELQDALNDSKKTENKNSEVENIKNLQKEDEIRKLNRELILHKDKIINLESKLDKLNIEFNKTNNIIDEINLDIQELSRTIIRSYDD